jgi:hypothetical protein
MLRPLYALQKEKAPGSQVLTSGGNPVYALEMQSTGQTSTHCDVSW